MYQQHREPATHQDDPDVLDAVKREQPLEVVLLERVQDADHRRQRSEREHGPAPRCRQRTAARSEQIEREAQHAVDRDLQHDAGHQCRDVARRGRMGVRQPDVERNHAGLHTEAGERSEEQAAAHAVRQAVPGGAQDVEVGAIPELGQRHEHERDQRRADVRHHDVEQARVDILVAMGLRDHECVAGERHRLPQHEEAQRVSRTAQERHRSDEHPEREHVGTRAPASHRTVRLQVRRAVDRGGRGDQRDHEQEERRQRVDAQRQLGERHEPGELDAQRGCRRIGQHIDRGRAPRDRTDQHAEVAEADRETGPAGREQRGERAGREPPAHDRDSDSTAHGSSRLAAAARTVSNFDPAHAIGAGTRRRRPAGDRLRRAAAAAASGR